MGEWKPVKLMEQEDWLAWLGELDEQSLFVMLGNVQQELRNRGKKVGVVV